MASRNEYEMLFKLSAQLGQNFNGTFSSAQKTLAATQKEIQSLNKLQSDISSYTKQQQSVDALKNKLSTYQQQLRNVQQEIAASGEYSASLANKELDLKQKIEKTEASLRQKTETLDRMGDSLSKAGVDMSNLSSESERLGKEVDDLKEKQEKAADEAQRFGDVGANSAIAVADALAAAGIAKILKEIYSAYGECIVGAASFGDEIGTVSVQYGIAAEDLQAYYYAAELVDVSVETLTSTMARNVRAMSYAQDGTARYVEAYEQLGVSVTNADGSLRDSEDVYWDVIDALGKMENASERDAVAMELLGRSAQQINTLIAAGSGVMDEYAQMAEQAGYVMDEKMLASVMALDDELQIQNNNMTALKNTVAAQFAPEITAALQLWNKMLAGMTEFAENNPVIVKSLVILGLELATIVGVYGGYVAIKKTANALKAINAALTAKQTVATTAQTAATVAQTTATTAATAAQTSLNAAMASNPVGLLLVGVSALTVGVVAFASAASKASKEEDQLTAKSKAEYAQLQKKEAEYKKLCKTYGETSYEAQSLKWEIDELSEAYENGKMTVKEYAEESAAYLEELRRAREEYNATMRGFDAEYDSSMALIEKLEELSNASQNAAQNQAAIIPIVDALNEKYQSLGLTFDAQTGKFNISISDMEDLAQAEVDAKKAEEAWKRYVQLVGENPAKKAAVDEAQKVYDASNAVYKAAKKEYDDYTDSFSYWMELIGTALGGQGDYNAYYNVLLRDWTKKYDVAAADKKILDEKLAAYNAAQEEMRKIEQEYGFSESMDTSAESAKKLILAVKAVSEEYMTAEEAAKYYDVSVKRINAQIQAQEKIENSLASALKAVRNGFMTASEAATFYGVSVGSIETHEKISNLTDEITSLSEAYQTAYDEAKKSISGQYNLWDKAAEVIPEDIATINAALETQNAYWHDYNVDLQSLKARSDEIEGLSDVVASFADGSKESVNVIAGMAQASDEELREMVKNWKELQSQQQGASESLATMESDYKATLADLQSQLETTINDLNLEDEAAAAAKATMDAYIEALQEGADEASTIAQELATQIGTALNTSSGNTAGGSGGGGGVWKSYQDAANAGFSNIRTKSEFARGGSDKEKYGTYDKYLEAMYNKYVGGGGTVTYSSVQEYRDAIQGITDEMVADNKANGRSDAYAVSSQQWQAHYRGAMSTNDIETAKSAYEWLRSYYTSLTGKVSQYHTGGFVGDVSVLASNEQFAKLLEGEFVSTPAQMKRFMDDTVPKIAEYGAKEAKSAQGIAYTVTIAPNFTLQGVEGDNMEDKFRECGDMVVDMVIDRLEEMGIDAKRGAYV